MTEPYLLGAGALAAEIRAGRLSAASVLESVLARIDRIGSRLNAFRLVLTERARREAQAVDEIIATGRDPGPLAGVPYGVKDLYDVEGLATTAGSIIGADNAPATRDAVLVSRLRAAGAVLLGVQIMDEYAYGFTTENAHYGTVHNPRDPARTAGGSSGGSAASVAAGLGAFALGSDTNGSIRVPASFCGIFGLKPTYGRLPRTGSFPFIFDLDHVGPFARSVADLALVYNVLQGFDDGDAACAPRPVEPVAVTADADFAPRAAVLDGWFHDMADTQAREAVEKVARVLSAHDRLALPHAEAVRAAAFLITGAAGANLHRANLRKRPQDFDPGTRGRLLAASLLPAGEIIQAQRIRRCFYEEVMAAFTQVDLLLAPATPCSAPVLGQKTLELNGKEIVLRPNIGALTQPLSAVGLPIVTVPIATDHALPIGVQIVAPPWREDLAFQAAARLEQAGLCKVSIAMSED